jgi:hypothetical protein
MKIQQIEITHHAHIRAFGRTGENPIIRVARNLFKQDYGGLSVLHKSRLNVAYFMKALGISAGVFGNSKPSSKRSRNVAQRLPCMLCKFCDRVGSRGPLKLGGKGD